MSKKLLQSVCPPVLWRLGEKVRRKLAGRRGMVEDPARVAELKRKFDQLNAGLPADEIMLRPGLLLKMHPESRLGFEYFCYHSPTMVEELDGFLTHSRGRERLLDIGALHGLFSLVFAREDPVRTALAVDASPIAFARLLYNTHKNGLSNIDPVEGAASDREGVLRMRYEWEHAVAAGAASVGDTIEVPMQTGDQLCAQRGFEPDVIKIDVEGHEIKVLAGLKQTLTNFRPLVFLEVHPAWIRQEGDSIGSIEDLFVGLNYSAQRADGSAFDLAGLASCESEERLVLFPNV